MIVKARGERRPNGPYATELRFQREAGHGHEHLLNAHAFLGQIGQIFGHRRALRMPEPIRPFRGFFTAESTMRSRASASLLRGSL